jgi:hypothetical protein
MEENPFETGSRIGHEEEEEKEEVEELIAEDLRDSFDFQEEPKVFEDEKEFEKAREMDNEVSGLISVGSYSSGPDSSSEGEWKYLRQEMFVTNCRFCRN